jgi:leucyl-tRNA synthetase
MHKKFDSGKIEAKWQARWAADGIYQAGERDESKEKEYVLVEWPYPSGNLHIGHWYAFAVPDIYVRKRRMEGKQVLFPMGFDAFGLPAENAAIKRNINPREWTESNIEYMKGQLASMGNAFSWDKTCSSTDPEYYKWTQWMFTQFFEKGIAYRGTGVVNWCPGCNTVIANEQVLPDDTCERCGSTIEKKEMPQWMLRITDYADRLIDDLDTLEWPEHIKEAQRQWIGRSKGAEIDFTLSTDEQVTIFTTRPDTLFGATFLVLAPEHPLVQKSKDSITNWAAVEAYIAATKQKDEQDRLDATKEKTGVKLEGITATNPGSGETIPVFIADYVLGNYGTGAIMAVPAHDERDNDFRKAMKIENAFTKVIARKNFGLVGAEAESDFQEISQKKFEEIILNEIQNEVVFTLPGIVIYSGEFDGMNSEKAKEAIVKKVGGRMKSTYRLRDWSIGRQRYWGVPIPIVYDPAGKAHVVTAEHLPWTLPEDVDFTPTGEPPLAKSEELKRRTEEIFGAGWRPEVETMDTFVDSSWYFLRYVDNHNSEALSGLSSQRAWLPVDLYFGGAEHTTMHLLYSRFWQKALYDLGLVTTSEPYRRRINRGLILGPDGNKMSKSKGNVIDPDEQVRFVGADTVKMYLAFMGPYEGSNYPWDMGGIAGLRRFLERVNGLDDHLADTEPEDITRQLHKTIQKVTDDIEQFKFNTAISAMMVFVNAVEKASLTKDSYELFLRILAPFAPHLTEELWAAAGHDESIHTEAWPTADPTLLTDLTITIGVQVNGRLRGNITLAPSASEDEAVALARAEASIQTYTASATITKVIYVPGRILNLIVG